MKRNPELPRDLARTWNNCLKRIKRNDNGCWEYHGRRLPSGYGHCCTPVGNKLVHVISYAFHCGPLVPELVVAHQCHNPACCNPVHLRLMSQKENVRQALERGMFRPSGKRKLPLEKHDEIKRRHQLSDQKERTKRQLAKEYGVSLSLIESIVYAKEVIS